MWRRVTALLLGIFLIVCSGCARKKHKVALVHDYITDTQGRVREQAHDGITCRVKPLLSRESIELFGTDFLTYDIQPYLIRLENHQKAAIYLSPQYISAPLVRDATIKEYLYTATHLWAWTSSALALVYFWPLIPCIIVPGAYYASYSNQAIDRFMQEYSLCAYERPLCIMPHEYSEKIFFVPGARGASFDIGVMRSDCSLVKFSY